MNKILRSAFAVLILLCFHSLSSAQEPFSTPSIDNSSNRQTMDARGTLLDISDTIMDEPAENFDLLDEANLQFTTDGATHFLPSISLNVIKYRLTLYSYNAKRTTKRHDEGSKVQVNLPLFFLSKLASSYGDSSGAARVSDVTSFAGSPLTIRAMPMYSWKVGLENSLTFGMVNDFRAIVLKDSTTGSTTFDFGYYGSIGLQYSGRGCVRDPETGIDTDGTWSLSALAYAFYSDPRIKYQLFKDHDKMIAGFEGIFKIKMPGAASRFNIFASFQYHFNEPIGMKPYMFKVAFGN
jgi:hypothetical protein